MKAKTLTLSVALAIQIAPGELRNGEISAPFHSAIINSSAVAFLTRGSLGERPSPLDPGEASELVTDASTQPHASTSTTVFSYSASNAAPKPYSFTTAGKQLSKFRPVIITPSVPPAVNQGTTFQFAANARGTWTCSGTDASGTTTGCKGSIGVDTGIYTAPSAVTAQQSLGGYQLLPNNHIFNTRVDSFPLRSDSSALISGAGTVGFSVYNQSEPINYVNGSTPTQRMIFQYTPANNGSFQMPAYPNARIEGGWISAVTNQNSDHHLLAIDTISGSLQELYQYYKIGLNRTCPLCNSQGGVGYKSSSYALPANGATDAAGMYLAPLILRLQEYKQAIATGGTINHALRMTLQNGYLHNAFLWPGTTSANAGAGQNYYGERVRLKSSFKTSSFSPIAQILLTQMKQYGLIIADGGLGWAVDVEYAKWPTAIQNALVEISSARIAPANFEVVDESKYMISASSGECTCNREIVTFTRASDGARASVDVVLTGVAVNFPQDLLQIQVGAPPQQLTALVNGASNTNVTWSMNPSVGTLTSSGLYTPPASLAAPTTITVTATSVANPLVAASMTLNVFPAGPIRLVPGNKPGTYNYTQVPTNYTDSTGNVWYPLGDDGGYAYDGGCSIAGTSDPTLYCYELSGYAGGDNDVRFDFIVPNGSYQIAYKGASTFGGLGTQIQDLEVNGTIVYPNLDLYAVSGGHNIAWDWGTSATVTDNKLSFTLRIVNNAGTHIGALQIAP